MSAARQRSSARWRLPSSPSLWTSPSVTASDASYTDLFSSLPAPVLVFGSGRLGNTAVTSSAVEVALVPNFAQTVLHVPNLDRRYVTLPSRLGRRLASQDGRRVGGGRQQPRKGRRRAAHEGTRHRRSDRPGLGRRPTVVHSDIDQGRRGRRGRGCRVKCHGARTGEPVPPSSSVNARVRWLTQVVELPY